MSANPDTGTASETQVGIETDMSGMSDGVFMTAIIAKTHRTDPDTSVTVDTFCVVDFNDGSKFSHKGRSNQEVLSHLVQIFYASCIIKDYIFLSRGKTVYRLVREFFHVSISFMTERIVVIASAPMAWKCFS